MLSNLMRLYITILSKGLPRIRSSKTEKPLMLSSKKLQMFPSKIKESSFNLRRVPQGFTIYWSDPPLMRVRPSLMVKKMWAATH
jgi:hypothetical protein